MKKLLEVAVQEGKDIDDDVRFLIDRAQADLGETITNDFMIGIPSWAVLKRSYDLGVFITKGNTVELCKRF